MQHWLPPRRTSGLVAEAQTGLGVFVRLLPGLTLSDPRLVRPFRRLSDRERFLAGLRARNEWFQIGGRVTLQHLLLWHFFDAKATFGWLSHLSKSGEKFFAH